MSCEKEKEGLKNLLPELLNESDELKYSNELIVWFDKNCPSRPDPATHTARLLRDGNNQLNLTPEQWQQHINGPIKGAQIQAVVILRRHGKLSD